MDFAKIISQLEFQADDTAIKNAEEELRRLNRTIKESKEGSLEWTEAMRKSKKIQDKLGKAVKSSENSIDGLEDSISKLIKKQRGLDLSTEKNRKEYAKLEDQINKKKKSLDSYQETLGKTSKSSNGLGSSLKGLAGKAGLVGAALFVGEKALQFGQYLVDIDKKYSTLFATVQRFSGLQGTTLQQATSDVVALAETYGKTEDEILKSTQNFANAYGISFTEALDLVEKGFLKGADTTGDFLSLLEEYPIQFKNANVSAETFIKTVTTGAGTGSSFIADKLPDTIKELGLRLRELDKAQLDALSPLGRNFTSQIQKDLAKGEKDIISIFKSIVDEARKVGLTTQQTQKLIADLGGGALEDLGGLEKAYELITKAQDENLEKYDELGERQKRQLELSKELSKQEIRLAENFNGLGKTLDTLTSQIKTNVLTAFNDLFDSIFKTDALLKQINNTKLGASTETSITTIADQIVAANKDLKQLEERLTTLNKNKPDGLFDEIGQFGGQVGNAIGRNLGVTEFNANFEQTTKLIEARKAELAELRKRYKELNNPIQTVTESTKTDNNETKTNNGLKADQIKKIKEARMALADLTQTLEFQNRQSRINLLPQNEERLELQFQLDTDKLLLEYADSIKDFKEKAKTAGLSDIEIEAGIKLREDLLSSQIDLAEKTLSDGVKKIANDVSAAYLEVDKLRVARFVKANDEILSDTERSERERLELLAANTEAELSLLDREQEEARRLLEENIEDEELKNVLLQKLDLDFSTKRKEIYAQTAQDVKQIRLDEVENVRSIIEDGLTLEEELLREKLLKGELTEKEYRDALLETRKFRIEQLIETLNAEEQLESTSASRKREIAIEVQQLRNDLYEEDVENQKKAEEEKQEKLEETLAIVKTTFDSIFAVLNELISQQIEALNELTDRQRKRVEDAEKIAEKGNAALLEQEQKRLDELEAKRQRSVERQRGIAAAEALINAVAAIVQGAAQGGLAGIAAVIGGVGAGIVAITQIVSGAFADGVIDFKGKGSESSDSNIVAISNRESVITAKGTKLAPNALRLINQGKLSDRDIFNTPNYALTPEMYMPVATDMRGVEQRVENLTKQVGFLAEAVDAMEFENNMGIDENGMFKMNNRAKKRIERRNSNR